VPSPANDVAGSSAAPPTASGLSVGFIAGDDQPKPPRRSETRRYSKDRSARGVRAPTYIKRR